MRLIALISTARSVDYTVLTLDSLLACTPLGPQDIVLVIDNDHGSAAALQRFANRIQIISNSKPLSFAANVNQAINLACDRGYDLFMLNNDLVLTAGWIEALEATPNAIVSPMSNREVQYELSIKVIASGLELANKRFMDPITIEEFQGYENQLKWLAAEHARVASGFLAVLTLPFFCVRLPLNIMKALGPFDESFTQGGEDFDYALRAWLKGFKVGFALNAYILHFSGRSTYFQESPDERTARQQIFADRFTQKWGTELQRLAFDFNASANASQQAAAAVERGEFGLLIEETLAQAGRSI